MIDNDQISRGRARISAEFLAAVQGPATQKLAAKDQRAAALGQHLHAATDQRGLLGTASAIEVLAQTPGNDARDYTRRLVYYVDRQLEIEQLAEAPENVEKDVEISTSNVIKMSEVLYALSFVPTSLAPREKLAARVADALIEHRNADGGWPYLMAAEAKRSHLLPTAFALRALASHGYELDTSITFLQEQVRSPASDKSDIFVHVLAIYILCFLPEQYRRDRELRRPFQDVWLRLSSLLNEDIEANIEYVTRKLNYVRIPWQLYLIASAARLSPYRRFASSKAQRRLKAILASVSTVGGLLYPHSGRDLSSRTNAILFDVLRQIDNELTVRRLPLGPFIYTEAIRSFISSKTFQYGVRVLAFVLIVYVVARWIYSGQTNVGALAPELISSVLLILLTGRRED